MCDFERERERDERVRRFLDTLTRPVSVSGSG